MISSFGPGFEPLHLHTANTNLGIDCRGFFYGNFTNSFHDVASWLCYIKHLYGRGVPRPLWRAASVRQENFSHNIRIS